jgi:divalent metal cation (Fe/Co/Zn/Cd) transporter
VGEGASEADVIAIRDAINAHPDVEALIHIRTLYLGPEELLVGAKVAFARTKKLADVATAIDAVEAGIRAAVPIARVIYLEPDVYVARGRGNPSTESIIIKAAD